MTRDYLVAAKAQLEGQLKGAQETQLNANNQVQALNGAIQALTQLIVAEDVNAAGGNTPDQGITGPGL
jgi:hypothetical protein